jgi:hypothetical protein
VQIEGEFPELLDIKGSLIKYVFEPNAAKKDEVRSAYRCIKELDMNAFMPCSIRLSYMREAVVGS